MIKKTFVIAILLFVFYSIFVALFAPKWWYASQHQWQDNVVNVQKYIYGESDTVLNVIIGSSLSCRLIMDSLPKTHNLSFGGQSIFDGLKILTLKSNLPRNIFIEMNCVLRPESKEFIQSINSQILYYPRQFLQSLRADKQPIAILGKIIKAVFVKIKSTLFPCQPYVINDKNVIKSTGSNTVFSKMLDLHVNEYSREPDQKSLGKSFDILGDYVQAMQNKGANIVFFEMPVNAKLENLPQAKVIRETFYKHFPTSKYNYIALPVLFEGETTDGVHLNVDGAIRYTKYFKSININYFR